MKYATITMLAPLGDHVDGIPPDWFDRMPEHAYFAASIIEEPEGVEPAIDSNAGAMKRKFKLDGMPKC